MDDIPGVLYFVYASLLLSLLCYIFLTAILIISKAYKIFTFRLILCYIFSNTVLVIGQIIFASSPTRGSLLEKPSKLDCQISGTITMFGWETGWWISLYMIYCVWRAVNGNSPDNTQIREFIATFVVYSVILIVNLLMGFYEQFEYLSWSLFDGKQIGLFCMMKFDLKYIIVTIVIDAMLLLPVIYFACQTSKLKRQLVKLGISFDHPVLQIQSFAFVYFGFMSMAGLTKYIDRWGNFQVIDNKPLVLGIVWTILNASGVFLAPLVTYMFLYHYIEILGPALPKKLNAILIYLTFCKCLERKSKKKKSSVESSLVGDVTDGIKEAYSSYSISSTANNRKPSLNK